jgi:hypothetical protein
VSRAALPHKAKRGKKMPRPRAEKPKTHEYLLMKLELDNWAKMLMNPYAMSKFQSLEIASYLHRLAQTPAAIDAMIPHKQPGRPPTKASRDWEMSLDYDVTKERLEIEKRGNSKLAQYEICAFYEVGRSVMLEAHKVCAANPNWKEWADYQRSAIALAHPNLKGTELLAEIINTLRK